MRIKVLSFIVLGAALGMQLGAMTARADDPKPAADATQKPAAATDAAKSADKPADAAADAEKAKLDDAATEKELRSMGYKPKMKHGEKWFCRREQILGSHFDQESCNTAQEILTQRREAQDAVRTMQNDRPQINK